MSVNTLIIIGLSVLLALFVVLFISVKSKLNFINGKYNEVSKKYNGLVDKYNGDVDGMKKEIDRLNSQIKGQNGGLDTPELRRAMADLNTKRAIRKGLVASLLDKLEAANLDDEQRLDERQRQEINRMLLQLAFATIDMTEDYKSSFDGTDSLAVRVATDSLTKENAASKAVEANFNVHETEKVYRALLAMIKEQGLQNQGLILNDRKF